MLTAVAPRRGTTLAELVVALTLAAIVLGTATSTLLRQQRTATRLGGAASSAAQLRAAIGAPAAEVAALAVGSGDLVPGEARDTALQLRALVASGSACDTAAGSALLAAEDDAAAGALAAPAPRVGDSLWWYADSAGGAWTGRRVAAADSVSAPCPLTAAGPAPMWRLAVATGDTIPRGAHLRVTRPVRYAFYRSGDGTWQLGLREWSEPSQRFAITQPIAGPFVMRAGVERTGFRYFDAAGAELALGPAGADAALVARLRITALVLDRAARAGGDSLRRDSTDVALQPARAR